jgi:hypothetical protein
LAVVVVDFDLAVQVLMEEMADRVVVAQKL